MTEEILQQYASEKKRISKVADTLEGVYKLYDLYNKQFGHKPHHVNDCIHEFARLSVFCNLKLV